MGEKTHTLDFAHTPLPDFLGETNPDHRFRPYSASPPSVHKPEFMGEKTHNPRFRPYPSPALYGRNQPRPSISPILSLPSARPYASVYGRKDPHPSISPRLYSRTLWAKPTPAIYFAHTQPSLRASISPSLWAKRPTPSISPILLSATFWAKPTPAIYFAHTQPTLRASISPSLWAKRPKSAVYPHKMDRIAVPSALYKVGVVAK